MTVAGRIERCLPRVRLVYTMDDLQVWFGTTDFEMNYKAIPTETDAEIIGCGILTCMGIVTPTILLR